MWVKSENKNWEKGIIQVIEKWGALFRALLPAVFLLRPLFLFWALFLASSFRPFFVFATFWLQNGVFQEKSRVFLAPFFRPPCFFFWKRPLFSFLVPKAIFFFSLFFHPFYFFSPSCLYNLVLYRLPISIFLHESGKTVDVSAR